MGKRYGFLSVLAVLLVACSTQDQAQFSRAAVTPLSDLNLVKKDIPEILQKAVRQPYAYTASECSQVWQEVVELDAALGPDVDKPEDESQPALLERGADEVKGSVVKVIGRTTEGVVPFRGWVRKLTGAEKHDRHVAAAITAGSVRRAFLKGVWTARDCRL